MRFAPDTFWRGEVHRLLDRPAALSRLLEEAAAAGAEQLILVSASPEPPGPHELAQPRLDPMGRLSEHAASMEAAVGPRRGPPCRASLPRRLSDSPRLQPGRRVRSRRRVRRALGPASSAQRADGAGLRRRLPRVHRTRRRRLRREPAGAGRDLRRQFPVQSSQFKVQRHRGRRLRRSLQPGVTTVWMRPAGVSGQRPCKMSLRL